MKKILTVGKSLVNKNFYILLFLVVLISYGQIINMSIWQDDNALFFKLSHINENAGYLSAGPIGSAAYKYVVTPYVLVYRLFGYSLVPYFLLGIIFYYFATLSLYFLGSRILNQKAGKISSFLFAAGYISSDGFIRLFNTVYTSITIILASFFVYCYWKFVNKNNYIFYFFSIILYFLASELGRLRTHYLILPVVALELIYFVEKKRLTFLIGSLLRVTPFLYIFSLYFVNSDQRAGKVGDFISALLKGEFDKTYSFISSFANLIVPDWFINLLVVDKRASFFKMLIILLLMIVVYFLLGRVKKRRRIYLAATFVGSLFWLYLSNNIYTTQLLNLTPRDLLLVFTGGILLIAWFLILLVLGKETKRIYIFFSVMVFANIFSYAAYQPTVSYQSINRLLAHSFAFLTIILSMFALKNRTVLTLVLLWGFGNMVIAVIYQRNLIVTRSTPVKEFYSQLRGYLPSISKGDALYFDVDRRALPVFEDAFSVASMPETTALAWRYGVDRYEFRRFTDFNLVISSLRNDEIKLDKLRTFYFSIDGLKDTTKLTASFLKEKSTYKEVKFTETDSYDEKTVTFQEPLESVTPVELIIEGKAKSEETSNLSFPYIKHNLLSENYIAKSVQLRDLAFKYKKARLAQQKTTTFKTSSEWSNNKTKNLNDDSVLTSWQSDRVSWGQGIPASIILDLGVPQNIDRVVWINGLGNNTPVDYRIDYSGNDGDWKLAAKVNSAQRVDSKESQVIKFDTVNSRFVKMTILRTLSGDSPIISEIWVVPSEFHELDIPKLGQFLNYPYGFIPDKESYKRTLIGLEYKNKVNVSWLTDNKSEFLITDYSIEIVYDNILKNYRIIGSPGGVTINKLKLTGFDTPGSFNIEKIKVKHLNLNEIYLTNL